MVVTQIVTKGAPMIARGISSVFNAVKRITVNPFAGKTLLQGAKSIGASVVKLGATGGTYGVSQEVTKSIITGKPIEWGGVVKSGIVGASFGLNPMGTTAGLITGAGSVLYNQAKQGGNSVSNLWNKTPSAKDYMPMVQTPNWNDIIASMKGAMQPPSYNVSVAPPSTNITMETPSSGGYSFSPSVSAGGGMGEILPLMLLMAGGAGALGYGLGRRKKKKYKKRKRRKNR
jgi:hypothetical protein